MEMQEAADTATSEVPRGRLGLSGVPESLAVVSRTRCGIDHGRLRKLCKDHFVSYLRMREWHDVHAQLHELVAEMGMAMNRHAAHPDAIHRALLAGLLGNVGYKSDGHEYAGPRGRKFNIFPGSVLFKHEPPWLMAAELVETTKLYAHTAAAVKPSWVEKVGKHLIQYGYGELRWDNQHAQG